MNQYQLKRLEHLDNIRSQFNDLVLDYESFCNKSLDIYNEAITGNTLTSKNKISLFALVKSSRKKIECIKENIKEIDELKSQIASEI
jgi:hypothetical protein